MFGMPLAVIQRAHALMARWRTLSLPYRLYVVAVLVTCLGYADFVMHRQLTRLFSVTSFLAAILFGLGFLLWIGPWLTVMWRTRRATFIAVHTAILFVAVIPSRWLVAEALGLPPQDFDLTVKIVAVELYPALWFLVVGLATAATSLIFMLPAFLCMMTTTPLVNDVLLFACKLLPLQSRARLFIEAGRQEFTNKAFGHFAGAVVISFAAIQTWTWHTQFIEANPNTIRWIAYAADYQFAPNYPDANSTRRLRLHGDGVVSYASRAGLQIEIVVEKLLSAKQKS